MTEDSTAHEKAEVAKLMAAERERDLHKRVEPLQTPARSMS